MVLLVVADWAGPDSQPRVMGGGSPPSGGPPPPATVALSRTPVLVTPQTPTSEPTLTQVASFSPTANSQPETATATPTARISPTVTVAPTAELVGRHRVRGEDGVVCRQAWYTGRYLAWREDVWRPMCDVNPQIAGCRLIFPGDVLGIPKRKSIPARIVYLWAIVFPSILRLP